MSYGRRRRTRYRATAERAGEVYTWSLLTYGPEDAFTWLERQGYYNIEVAAARRKPVGARQPARWEVNPVALRDACALLGITWEVKITRTTSRSQSGSQSMTAARFGKRHCLTVDKLADHVSASKTLWHELQHAAQAERCATWSDYMREHKRQRGYAYAVRPCEVEARATAEAMADVILTRPRLDAAFRLVEAQQQVSDNEHGA